MKYIVVILIVYTVLVGFCHTGTLLEEKIQDDDTTGVLLHRRKRVFGSLVSTLCSTQGSKARKLGIYVTEGCAFYPSICEDRAVIERLEQEIKVLRVQYDDKYVETKKEYVDLVNANKMNGYIMYYINKTAQQVESVGEYMDKMIQIMHTKLDEVYKNKETMENSTADKYLQNVIGDLVMSLTDINRMINEKRYTFLRNLLIGYLVEYSVKKVVKSISRAFKQVAPNDFYSKNGRFKRLFKRITYTPKVLKQMARNTKDYFKKSKNSLKGWKRVRSWKGFKDKLKQSLPSPNKKITHTRKLLSSSSYRKKFMSSHKLSGSAKISLGLSMLGDTVSFIIQHKHWKKLAEKVREARKKHEQYRDNLKKQIVDITAQSKEMAAEWPEVINTLNESSQSFRSLMNNTKRHANFSDVLGLSKLPVDASSPFFSLDFNSVTRQNINKAQEIVQQFMIGCNNDLSELADLMFARIILYENVQKMTAKNESVQNMVDSLQKAYEFSTSQTIKDYGKSLKRQDVVCTISRYLMSDTMYDFYQLEPFRPQCDVNATEFQQMKDAAKTTREASANVRNVLSTCKKYKFCPCPKMIAAENGIAESDVIEIIKILSPEMSEYCGTTGCDCIIL